MFRLDTPGVAVADGAAESATAHAATAATNLMMLPVAPTSLVFVDAFDASCSSLGSDAASHRLLRYRRPSS